MCSEKEMPGSAAGRVIPSQSRNAADSMESNISSQPYELNLLFFMVLFNELEKGRFQGPIWAKRV
jgi:hypothetical protein